MDRRARRCGDHRAEPRWPDHGLAGKGGIRDFDPLLPARQHDLMNHVLSAHRNMT
jgi:hypothetical protein